MTGYQALLAVHVLGASVWAGGHLVLSLAYLPAALKSGDFAALRAFEGRFEKVGIPALVVQILTGMDLARRLVPMERWFAFESVAERHLGVKLGLLAATILLALHARLRLVPRLSSGGGGGLLALHILLVTAIAVALVVVGVGFRTGGIL